MIITMNRFLKAMVNAGCVGVDEGGRTNGVEQGDRGMGELRDSSVFSSIEESRGGERRGPEEDGEYSAIPDPII